MILSASRRTDIPAFFSDWFFARMREGYACVRNPFNPRQVSRVDLSPEVVDCIVFWSKNPEPMLPRLDELEGYAYYFQYTLNGYGQEVEPGLPSLDRRTDTFLRLSERLGKERVVWRYDPIFFSGAYTPEAHLERFERMAARLSGAAEKCVVSLMDEYPGKNTRALARLGAYRPEEGELERFFAALGEIARRWGFTAATCAESLSLERYGIGHNSCIDRRLIERLTGYPLKVGRDGQRPDCLCAKCEDIGAYDTCPHGCVYCYANARPGTVRKMFGQYEPDSPLLCGQIGPQDAVTRRPVRSLRRKEGPEAGEQLTFFQGGG